jgi:putative transposase
MFKSPGRPLARPSKCQAGSGIQALRWFVRVEEVSGRHSRTAADFFTTEVWTPCGLVTYYTLFVMDLKSRRVQIVGSTPNPDAAFMAQAARLTDTVDGFLAGHGVLICDRDSKWTSRFRALLEGASVRIVLTPVQAPNANAYAGRFV